MTSLVTQGVYTQAIAVQLNQIKTTNTNIMRKEL